MASSLYICYFGLLEPLVQTQVLPYLRELLKDGHTISLLTFEADLKGRWTADSIAEMRERLRGEGIEWDLLAYHKRFSVVATAYDIFRGTAFVWNRLRRGDLDILHGRVHIPVLMAALARKLSTHKPKILFDIRGFFPEEYTDAGFWPENGVLYRTTKLVERWLLDVSDAFVVLTENARSILFPESLETGLDKRGRPIEVIPCCISSARFPPVSEVVRSAARRELGVSDRRVVIHTGSLGGLYLTSEIADLLFAFRKNNPATFALFLTRSDPALIVPLLTKHGFAESDMLVRRVSPSEVPKYLSASDVGLSFVRSGYATASRSPTKVPEYLACGLPVIANAGVGDVDEHLSADRTGVLVDELTESGYDGAVLRLDQLMGDAELRARCRGSALERFDLDTIGGPRYSRLYSETVGD